ncbi:MAG: low-specificity L-threonine aldolase, partial [Lysobacteraceae bacterium]
SQIEGLTVGTPQTNIFWLDIPPAACEPLRQYLARAQIRASIGPRTRLVTHLDVSSADVARTVEVFQAFFADWRGQ